MLQNYVVAALRNLARNRLYAAISVGGLAVAFAAAILIAIFVGDEFSYDRWIPGAKDVYRVSTNGKLSNGPPQVTDTSPPDVAGWMKLDFPQIVAVARLYRDPHPVRHGQVEAVEQLLWADPEFFAVLPLPTVAGDLKTALARPDSVVLTRTLARKYFGVDNPIGQILLLDRRYPLRVTAVLKDLPSNTHLRLTIVASGKAPFSQLARLDAMSSDGRVKPWSAHTYFRLAPGQSAQPIIDRMPAFVDAHMPGYASQKGLGLTMPIVPIVAIHFSPRALVAMAPRGDLVATFSMAGIGVLILLMASINFINLMTARASRRAVEVGVRKLVGASRRALMVQFIGEAMIYVALGALTALGLAELLLPALNAALGRSMTVDYAAGLPAIVALVLLIGVLAGAYPALVLSGFRPAAVLKGGVIQGGGSAILRQGLVALQFAVLIGLIVATTVIWRQTAFATKQSLRLDSDQMLLVFAPCVPDAFKTEIAALPGVAGAACSMMAPLYNSFATGADLPQGRRVTLFSNEIGFDFFELYGLKPLAGRFFSRAYGGDATSVADDQPSRPEAVVINETAMRDLGFARPGDAVGKRFAWTHIKTMDGVFFSVHPAYIIGVVEDFPMGSIRGRIEPTAFYVEPDQQTLINVKLKGRDIPETMTALGGLWSRFGHPGQLNSQFLDQVVQNRYRDVTQQGQLFTVFAGIAVFIACLGLFGLAAFATESRTKEVGIRKTMGATPWDILRLFLWEFSLPVLWANLIAWPVAFLVMTRWLHGFAYRIDLTVWPFLLAALAAMVIAWLTVLAQALTVARGKPAGALRYE